MPKEATAKQTKKAAGKTRAKKDPNAPKKPMSAFFFYSKENRERIKQENPDITFGLIGRQLGEEWRGLDATQKSTYEKKAEADKSRYERDLAAYKADGGGQSAAPPPQNDFESE
ncbi:high mobility group box domain-containing protein [Phlyctochytrium arcticum]|nr:high mobility group box domain-containing protein [Phlyctochytrium arcticum]